MPDDRTVRHLAELYASSTDPWRHRTRPYERGKHAATVAAIAGRPRVVLEIGCGNGSLTLRLLRRARHVVAVECVEEAFREARRHVGGLSRVTLVRGAAPAALPECRPDIVLLSEVLYFMTAREIVALALWCRRHARRGMQVLTVDYLGPTGRRPGAQQARRQFHRALGLAPELSFHGGYSMSRVRFRRSQATRLGGST